MENREIKYEVWDSQKQIMGTQFKKYICAEDGTEFQAIGFKFIDGMRTWIITLGEALANSSRYTVRKYTGHIDKNDKPIYEHDILRGCAYPFISDGEENYLAIVQWDAETAGFYSYPRRCSDRVRGSACDDYVFAYGYKSSRTFEVIGNQFENPELLTQSND